MYGLAPTRHKETHVSVSSNKPHIEDHESGLDRVVVVKPIYNDGR